VVAEFTPEEQRQFLSFVSGSDRAPIRGLGDLPLVIQRAGPDSDRLPTASTCFTTLLLPEYTPGLDKMRAKLKAAIRESEGFGLI
jgi:ubiquitin-protein ligase E3 A